MAARFSYFNASTLTPSLLSADWSVMHPPVCTCDLLICSGDLLLCPCTVVQVKRQIRKIAALLLQEPGMRQVAQIELALAYWDRVSDAKGVCSLASVLQIDNF